MHAEATLDASLMSGVSSSQALAAAQLVRQATGGDLDAFEELLRRLQRRVYGFAYQHLRDVDEAHDLAQEIFVKLYRNLGATTPSGLSSPGSGSWPRTRPSTTGASGCRSRQSCQTKPSTKPRPPGRTIPCSSRRSRSSTPLYRLPILLHYYADLSLEQVGHSLNLSVPAIKSRLHRARAQLRNALAEAEEGSR